MNRNYDLPTPIIDGKEAEALGCTDEEIPSTDGAEQNCQNRNKSQSADTGKNEKNGKRYWSYHI